MMLLSVAWRLVPVALGLAGAVQADDWPRWRGPGGDGIARETGWRTQWPGQGPPVVWRSAVGVGFSTVSVVGESVYTLGNQANRETVYCINAQDGSVIWQHSYDCPLDPNLFEGGPTASPAVDGDRLYTLSRQGHLFCFDRGSGEVIWQKQVAETTGVRVPTWGFSGSPVIHQSLLLLNIGGAGAALDKLTGETVWVSGNEASGYTTPVLFQRGDKTLICLASAKAYHAVDVVTGREEWQHRWLTRFGINAADPIIQGDRVFVSSGYKKGAVLLDVSGEEPVVVWKDKVLATQLNPVVLMGEHLYGITGDTAGPASLRCVEFETGAMKWERAEVGFGSVSAAAGHLIVLSGEGLLMVGPASPAGFEPTGRLQLPAGKYWTAPVLANGRLYCRSAAGDLFCLDVSR